MRTCRYPLVTWSGLPSTNPNSPDRARSNVAAPDWANSSNPRLLGSPYATREADSVPVAPEANVAVKVARSSFSTGSRTSLTAAPAWPTTAPSGSGRSATTVDSTAPRIDSIGPHRNSPTSIRWLPMSDSAPEPGPPLYRQLIGALGSQP